MLYGESNMQIVAPKIAVELADALERINDGRIALQCHADLEPVGVHRRDLGSLAGLRGFLFDDRREGHELPNREPAIGGGLPHLRA